MTPEAPHRLLTGMPVDGAAPIQALPAARAARESVAARRAGVDQAGAISAAPPELDAHIAALLGHQGSAQVVDEGWEVKLADLRHLVAIQPLVFARDDGETEETDAADLPAIARVSIPIPTPPQFLARYEHERRAWMLSSVNTNLRAVHGISGEAAAGVVGFGFGVELPVSMVQVVRFQGRLLLRDGYHRAYDFLRRGIATVPVFFRERTTLEDIAIGTGPLPAAAFLGERPPTLSDFLDDDVAADVRLPATQKTIVISVTERIEPLR